MAADPRIELVDRLTEACSEEIASRDPAAAVPWPTMPTVAALVAHLGGVHRWVTEVVRTRRTAVERDFSNRSSESAQAWFEEGRVALLDALTTVAPETPCWILGDRVGTVAFWRRRMVFENVKHLIDLRASGGGPWAPAPELTPDDYADGIDELLSEFLPRIRPSLPRLPGVVVLRATDSGRSWRIDRDWTTDGTAASGVSAEVVARAGDLALVLWERADPLRGGDRFRIEGSHDAVATLRSTSIHPW